MAIQTTRSGATAHPEEMLDFFMSHILDQSGVKSIDATGDFYVSESSTPAMSVKVNLGYAFVQKADKSKTYPVRMYSSTETVTIDANASGNSRIDTIVLYIDLAETPNSTATDVAKLVAVKGTPSGSPTAPTDGDISTAIGASNPFLRLSNVTVTSGASSIVNANITDVRVRAINVRRNKPYNVVSDGSTVTFDVEQGDNQVTLGGNRTLAIKNQQAGDSFTVKLIQDTTGGRTVTWFSTINWSEGIAPTLTSTGNRADVFGFKVKADGKLDGFIVDQGLTI